VEANELSVPAVLNGIRAGRTFVDLTASYDKEVDFEAEAGGHHARMGETLHFANEEPIHIKIHTAACAGSFVHLLLDGAAVETAPPIPVNTTTGSAEATLTVGAGRHWLRVEIWDGNGKLQLVSSPVYVNFAD
jgi:hypothetical protein